MQKVAGYFRDKILPITWVLTSSVVPIMRQLPIHRSTSASQCIHIRDIFATHLLKAKLDVHVILVLLRKKLGKTAIYASILTELLREVISDIALTGI